MTFKQAVDYPQLGYSEEPITAHCKPYNIDTASATIPAGGVAALIDYKTIAPIKSSDQTPYGIAGLKRGRVQDVTTFGYGVRVIVNTKLSQAKVGGFLIIDVATGDLLLPEEVTYDETKHLLSKFKVVNEQITDVVVKDATGADVVYKMVKVDIN